MDGEVKAPWMGLRRHLKSLQVDKSRKGLCQQPGPATYVAGFVFMASKHIAPIEIMVLGMEKTLVLG